MKNKLHILVALFLVFSFQALSQTGSLKQVKLINFDLQSSALITASGEELSTSEYKSKVYWFPVKVPSTVLTGLVANGIYPDPYSGLNNMLIPDASDEFNKKYDLERLSYLPNDPNPWKKPYWYRKETSSLDKILKEEKGKADNKWTVQITNNTGKMTFFIRPQLMSCGEEILPSFWSESYFTLAPGESTAVSVKCPSANIVNSDPVLKVSGWNVPALEMAIKKN